MKLAWHVEGNRELLVILSYNVRIKRINRNHDTAGSKQTKRRTFTTEYNETVELFYKSLAQQKHMWI